MPSPFAKSSTRSSGYCWLKFLAAGDNLALHLHALSRAHHAVSAYAPRRELPVTVQLAYSSTLWRTRARGADALLSVNEGFLSANDAIWTALIRHALCSGGAGTRHAVESFAATEPFGAVLFEAWYSRFRAGCETHFQNEEELIFPLAPSLLASNELDLIAQEMDVIEAASA